MNVNQPVVLKNITCCYCRTPLGTTGVNKEHVVARRFVPKGTLDRSWNMIARACIGCNVRKSDFEDDMSVLSMQHYPFDGKDVLRDNIVAQSLSKASRTYSRHAKKKVSDSFEESTLEMDLGSAAHVSFGFVAPPQIRDDRAFALANMHGSLTTSGEATCSSVTPSRSFGGWRSSYP